MVEWTDDESLRLIELYKSKALLWDPRHSKYYNKNMKDGAWKDIARELSGIMGDRSAVDCKNKMVSLLASHRRENNKTKKSRKGSSKLYVSRWFAYEALKFLNRRYYHARKRKHSETLDESVDDEVNALAEEDEEEEAATYAAPSNHQPNNPSPPKQPRMDQIQETALISALNIIKDSSRNSSEAPPETEEMAAFFKYVTQKTKNYSPTTKIGVQHAIFEILIQADRGFYEQGSSSRVIHSNADSIDPQKENKLFFT